MTEFLVRVTQTVRVKLDKARFTPEFMDEFVASFYPYDTLEEHAEHIAQLQARGVYDIMPNTFIEGYGHASDMGIEAEITDAETEVEATA